MENITQTQHIVESTGVLNNNETFFWKLFLEQTDTQALLLKYLRYLKKIKQPTAFTQKQMYITMGNRVISL